MKIGLILLAAIVAFGQAASDDPHGWADAKWGMSREEIQAKFPAASEIDIRTEAVKQVVAEYSIKLPPEFGLASRNVNGRKYAVAFFFDRTGYLSSVRLSYQKAGMLPDGTEVPFRCESCSDAPVQNNSRKSRQAAQNLAAHHAIVAAVMNRDFISTEKDHMVAALIEKYGPVATHKPQSGLDAEQFIWLYPETIIKVEWSHGPDAADDFLDVWYRKREKRADL